MNSRVSNNRLLITQAETVIQSKPLCCKEMQSRGVPTSTSDLTSEAPETQGRMIQPIMASKVHWFSTFFGCGWIVMRKRGDCTSLQTNSNRQTAGHDTSCQTGHRHGNCCHGTELPALVWSACGAEARMWCCQDERGREGGRDGGLKCCVINLFTLPHSSSEIKTSDSFLSAACTNQLLISLTERENTKTVLVLSPLWCHWKSLRRHTADVQYQHLHFDNERALCYWDVHLGKF